MADKKFVPPPPIPDNEPAFVPPPPIPDVEAAKPITIGNQWKAVSPGQLSAYDKAGPLPPPDLGEKLLNPVVGPMVGGMTALGRGLIAPSSEEPLARRASDLIEGAGTVMLPLALPGMLGNPLAAGLASLIGLGAQRGGQAIANAAGASPDTSRLIGDVSGAISGPLAARGAGIMLGEPAPMLAKSAFGIKGGTEAYGATPGEGILNETTGIRRATVEASARGRIADLGKQLENKAATTPAPLSLAPARTVLANLSNRAAAANSVATPAELAPMQRQLMEPGPQFAGATQYPPGAYTPITVKGMQSTVLGPNGQPIVSPQIVRGAAPSPVVSESQPASQFLNMKRQFDKDFISNWNPAANTKGSLGAARQAYGAMADEFNRGVPGAEELNQRISSLIPVADRARLTGLNAGTGERVLARAGRPTGGMFPILFGYHEGGIPGALAAIGGTEGLQSPEVKMLLARGLFSGGRGLENSAPSAALVPLAVRNSQ